MFQHFILFCGWRNYCMVKLHSLVDEHLTHFYFFAIVDSDSMKMHVHVFIWVPIFNSFGIITGIARSWDNFVINFSRNHPSLFEAVILLNLYLKVKISWGSILSYPSLFSFDALKYGHVLQNSVSVSDRLHVEQWSQEIITELQIFYCLVML